MNPNGVAESPRSCDDRPLLSRPAFLRDMLLSLFFAALTGVLGGLMLILLVFGCNLAQAETGTPTHGLVANCGISYVPKRRGFYLMVENRVRIDRT